jgi:phage/plasmid-like protein (TIGR03299 family)
VTTTETTNYRIDDARAPLWFGRWPSGWGDVVHGVDRGEARSAAAMIDAAGLAWAVEQHPLEAVLTNQNGGELSRVPVPRVVANVRSDTRAVLGVVGKGYEPLQNAAAFAFCDAITDSGEARWLGAAETRGGARVHALMQLDREIRIGNAEGEDVLPLLSFRNGHDGGLAVTISVAPFRLACLNGMMLPLDGAERTWKARHTANLDARLADARRTLGIAWRYYDELEQIGGRLIRERMNATNVRVVLARCLRQRFASCSSMTVPHSSNRLRPSSRLISGSRSSAKPSVGKRRSRSPLQTNPTLLLSMFACRGWAGSNADGCSASATRARA